MSEPFLSEIRMFSFNYAPRGWSKCDGQLLPINQNQALFSLLGTTFGGDGQTTFALPELRGRAPIHFGSGSGLTSRQLGVRGGEETHALIASEMPSHTHVVNVVNRPGTQSAPANGFPAAHRGGYAESGNATLGAGAVTVTGSSQPHENMPPYLAVSFCIALQGIFPSQN